MSDSDEQFSDAELRALLSSIDHPAPSIFANDIIRRARSRSGWRSALLAAAAVLAVATAATATVRGSFITHLLGRMRGDRPAQRAQSSSNVATQAALARGIAFIPGARLEVDFRVAQQAGALQVRWADASSVLLTQTGAKGEAHYALTPTGVLVDNERSNASYSLVLPRSIDRVHVRLAGRELFAKESEVIRCIGNREASDVCTIMLTASARR